MSQITDADKILLVTAERVGDALFVTPAIRLLRQYLPNTTFDALAMDVPAAQVFDHNPNINKIWTSKNPSKIASIAKDYPVVINLMYEMSKHLEQVTVPLFEIGKPDESKHRVDQAVDFVYSLFPEQKINYQPAYELFPQTSNSDHVKSLLKQSGVDIDQDILIACQLSCHRVARRGWKFWNSKRHIHKKVWPIENYEALAKKLQQHNKHIRMVLTGSPKETFLAKWFQKECPEAVDLIGKTSIPDVAELMKYMKLLVTHDTGTLHIACAMQTPIVAMYGPTPVSFTGPYPQHNDKFKVIMQPNINDISVDKVYEAVLEFGRF